MPVFGFTAGAAVDFAIRWPIISRGVFFKGGIILVFNIQNLIWEFKNCTWKEDQAGKATNEPIDKFNHGIDAVRYVCLAKVMVNRKRMVKVSRV